MRKRRSALLFILIFFFMLLILDAKISESFLLEHEQKKEVETIKKRTNKNILDKFEKEFMTYWWSDYKLTKKYGKVELDIYLPHSKSPNKFFDINDVATAIALREYRYKDKKLKVLIFSNKGKRLALLKKGKITQSFSNKVHPKVIETRLEEWKKANSNKKSHQ